MSKKVLVTGATGFTGGHLAEELVNKGYKVRALSLPNQDTDRLEKLGVEIVFGDLTKKNTLLSAVDGIDIVFHIAAIFREQNVPHQLFFDVNVGGTKNLLEAARDANVKRFVHCSTVGVQGEIKNPPAKETDPYNAGDYYQNSKVEGEKLALKFFKENDIEGVVFRPVGIYGPGDTRFLKIFKFQGRFFVFLQQSEYFGKLCRMLQYQNIIFFYAKSCCLKIVGFIILIYLGPPAGFAVFINFVVKVPIGLGICNKSFKEWKYRCGRKTLRVG